MASIKTLAQLIRSSSINSVSWVFNADKVSNTIEWVSVSMHDLRPNSLLLLNLKEVTHTLIFEAKKNRVSGILIFGNSLPAINKSFGLPIGLVKGKNNVKNLQKEMITLLINQEVSKIEQRDRIHYRLSQLSADGKDLQEITKKMQEVSGSGIVVQDKYLSILANYPPPILSDIWGEILNSISTQKNLPESLINREQAGQQRSLHAQMLPGNISRLISPIIVRGVVRGYFSIINATDKLDEIDRIVAEEGAYISAIEMSKAKSVRETEKKLSGDLLTALLNEELDPREAALWADEMGIDLSSAHAAIQFCWDSENPPSRRRLESLINGEIARLNEKIVLSPMASNIVCFIQLPENRALPNEAIAFAQEIFIKGLEEYPDANIRCGIGSLVNSLDKWQISFTEASKALEMAKRLKEIKPLYYNDLSIYRLLILIENLPELQNLYNENLGKLISQKDNLEIIPTLNAYFENNQNLSSTAKALFIHRNTLLHRLKRIGNISGIDFDNADTKLGLQIALKVHKMK
jgi:PucR family transcriptional regulator, purine catabolism regulatory protein